MTGSEIMAAFRKAAGNNQEVVRERIKVINFGVGGAAGIYDFNQPYLRLMFGSQEGDLVHLDGRREKVKLMVNGRRVEVPFNAIELPTVEKGNGDGKKKKPVTRKRRKSRRMPSQSPVT